MKIRRPFKYALVVAGLAAGWAAGGALDGRGGPEKAPVPQRHREPQKGPATSPTTKAAAAVHPVPSPLYSGGRRLSVSTVASTITAHCFAAA